MVFPAILAAAVMSAGIGHVMSLKDATGGEFTPRRFKVRDRKGNLAFRTTWRQRMAASVTMRPRGAPQTPEAESRLL